MFTFQSSEGKPDDMSFGHYNEPFACKGVSSDPVNDVGREDGKKSDVTTYHVTGVLLHRNADPGCTFAIAAKAKQRVCPFISGTLKPRTDDQVFLDKFFLDKFYLLVCTT